jgi:predicted Rossmann fold nucleotide-binding protein DprA/Smf involved in DNA uptake
MMTREEQAALLAWLRRPKVVWSTVTEQLEECGSVQAAAAGASPAQDALFDIAPTDDLAQAAADLDRWEHAGIRMVSVLDREYPSNLRMIHQRPPVLFLRGTADERDAASVAVVGTRQASPQGLDQARDLAAARLPSSARASTARTRRRMPRCSRRSRRRACSSRSSCPARRQPRRRSRCATR